MVKTSKIVFTEIPEKTEIRGITPITEIPELTVIEEIRELMFIWDLMLNSKNAIEMRIFE